ncbi:MAG: chromate efflux transporter [Deltaproteobacteria bacterium]|nr:chromate efflux transporter [Deltaproteobacteria bacterium]
MVPLTLLCRRFLKIGAIAYGGPAIAGKMKEAVVKDYGWLEDREFMQGMAFCQMLPGATWVMMATFIGYRLRGIWGAFTCAVSFVLPPFVLLVILSALYFKLGNLWVIQSLFKGLGAIVVAIVLKAVIGFSRSIIKDWKAALIAILAFLGFIFRLNIMLVFILAALAALLLRPQERKAGSPPSPVSANSFSLHRANYLFLGALAILIGLTYLIIYLIHTQLSYLCLILFKLGALAFGGGLTIIPLIQFEVVDRFQWVTTKEFLDGIALGQVTPGPVMITSTFLGYKLAGFYGALMATIAMFAPAFLLISLLLPFHDRLKEMRSVRTMEQGILSSFIAMLGLVLYNFGRATFLDIPSVIFTAVAFLALVKKIDLTYILLTGAILSILIYGFLL